MNIFYILLLPLLSDVTFNIDITETDAMEKTDRYVTYNIHRIEFDGRLANGQCCRSYDIDTCQSCYSYLDAIRTDKSGNKKKISIVSTYSNPLAYYTYKVLPIMTTEYKSLYLEFTTYDRLIDDWMPQETTLVGIYSWNGVRGNYGNALLYASVQFHSIRQYKAYAVLNMRIYMINWISKTFSDGTYCNTESNSSYIRACQFYVTANAENTKVWKSGISSYNEVELNSYYLKMDSGTTMSQVFKDKLNMTLEFHESHTDKLIDSININLLQILPATLYEKTKIVGTKNKLSIDYSLIYECVGYSGINCQYFCHENASIVGCRSDNGAKYCMNGASNPPECDSTSDPCVISPCVNGGKCIPLKNATACECSDIYKGAYCEIPNCDQACKNGYCSNNKCICNSGYEGDACNTVPCSDSESSYCKNGGICKKKEDEIYCICPAATSGKSCETPMCKEDCNYGECALTNVNGKVTASCKCLPGYSGNSCGIQKLVFDNADKAIYPIIISILAIMFVTELKLLLSHFIISRDVAIPENTKNIVTDEPAYRPRDSTLAL